MKIKLNRWMTLPAVALLATSCYKEKAVSKDELDDIIAHMTLEEKVGQMTNLTLSTVAIETDSSIKLDSAKLYDVIVKHHVGSIQNVDKRAYDLVEWHYLISNMQRFTLEKTRHKIPFLYCIDAVHGANYINGATLFPHNIGLAATWNPELVKECASITAAQTRAAGIRYNFAPVLDVGRNQQWSRMGETFGEDTYLVTQMGTAAIRGFEGGNVKNSTKVAACMKHFLGYSVPLNGKDRAPAYIPEIVLREHFLPPFREAVKTGVHTLMVNSAEINGTPVHASKYLLTTVLREELGFKGVVITDWLDIMKLYERHKVAASHKEAVLLCVEAGIDMCIVPFDFSFSDDLIALVKEGKIPEKRIDASVKRILTLKKELGLFDNPSIEEKNISQFHKPDYSLTAYHAALESITLLKNDSILPLSSEKKVLVAGPLSHLLSSLHGAWSYSWQGNKEHLYPDSLRTIADVFLTQHKAKSVVADSSWSKEMLWKQAKSSDAIVVVVGEPAYAETPGNIPDLAFDPAQTELIKSLAKSGKPIVAVLLGGRPRIIREIEPYCKAILMAYWPGSQGGQAIYDVIMGHFNPCGKLPFTYPRYSGSLITYDHKLLDEAVEIVEPYQYFYEFKPQYEFGHGLSYTRFNYSDLQLNHDTLSEGDSLVVSLTVTNTGARGGHEVVQLYSKDLVASITPAVKRLRRFEKIYLLPGESKKVNFKLWPADLAFVNSELKWVTEKGGFEILLGDLKAEFVYN
jgi:beta-glucosidase